MSTVIVAAVTIRADGGSSEAGDPHQHDHHAMATSGPLGTSKGERSSFEREMDEGMGRMMTDMHSPGYTGNADVDFLVMMVPHHQGAVDMARIVLQHGHDPATRVLAEEIIAGQTIEIQSMQRRLDLLRKPSSATAEMEFPVLGGTRGP